MGESASAVAGNFLHPDELNRTGYRVVPGGVVVPPRRDNNGRSPAFDPRELMKTVKVNIIDGDTVTALNPGEADEFGNPKPKEDTCPSSSPLSRTPTMAALDSPAPLTSSAPLLPEPSAIPPSPGSGDSTTTKTAGRAKRQREPAPLPEILTSTLQQLSQRLSSLESVLSSPMKSTTASPPLGSTSAPSSASGSPLTSSSSPARRVKLDSVLGSVTFEVIAVSLENEGLILLVVDPKKPHMIPKSGDVLVTVDDRKAYHCQAHELSLKLTLGGQEVLIVLLVLLEDMTP